MKINELIEFFNKITYKGRHCVRLSYRDWRNGHAPCPEGYMYVSIWVNAICVETGKTTQIESGHLDAIKDLEQSSESSHLSHIRHVLMVLEMHEVDETLAVDGKRIFDPHDLHIRKIDLEQEQKVA